MTKSCENCGASFVAKSVRARYCTQKCRTQAHRKRKGSETPPEPKQAKESQKSNDAGNVTSNVTPSKDSELVALLRSELAMWQDQCKQLNEALSREQHLHAGTLAELKQTRIELQAAKDVTDKSNVTSTVTKQLKSIRNKLYKLRKKLGNEAITDEERRAIETEIQDALHMREMLHKG